MRGRGGCEVLRARRLQEDPLRARKIRSYSAISAVTHATSTMASAEAPRETSFKGFASPWMIRAHSSGSAQPLHELVGDVGGAQVRKDQNVCETGHG